MKDLKVNEVAWVTATLLLVSAILFVFESVEYNPDPTQIFSAVVLGFGIIGATWLVIRWRSQHRSNRRDGDEEPIEPQEGESWPPEWDDEVEEEETSRPNGEESNPPPTGRRVPDEEFRDEYRENYS